MTTDTEYIDDLSTSEYQKVSWVKADLFVELLKSKEKQFKKIINFKIYPALKSGENYVSNILRVEIDIELQTIELKKLFYILKLPKENQLFEEIKNKHNAFIVELGMYKDILPEFQKLYEQTGSNVKFCASGYKLNTPYVHILFDDLSPNGFKVADRLTGLNMEHVTSVLKKLAQLHAASAKFVEINGQYDKMYKYGFFTEKEKPFIAAIKGTMGETFLKCAENYPNNEPYIESVRNLQSRFIDEFYKTIEIDDEEFNVLNHGDCWTNNIMYQYDDCNNIKETYLIDFQIPKYGSPAQDLLYFLMSSPKLELKLKKFDFLISYYHENLVASLKLLKYSGKIPSLRDIHCTLFKHGFWGYEAATGALAAVLVKPTKNACFKNFYSKTVEGEEFRKLLYSNENYVEHMRYILPWLLNRGALDCSID